MSRPLVAIDASPLEAAVRTGVERLLHGAVRSLAERVDPFRFLLVSRRPIEVSFPLDERFETCVTGEASRWRERVLVPLLRARGAALLHSPYTAVPRGGRFLRIATVHELSWQQDRFSEGVWHALRHRRRLRHTVRLADRIVVPSVSTRRQLEAVHPEASGRVHRLRPGLETGFSARGDDRVDARARDRLGVPDGPYMLAVGALRRRKNPGALVRIARAVSRLGVEIPLVVAGPSCGASRVVERAAKAPRPAIVVLGHVGDDALAALYRGAAVLVHPSRSEGFGFPIAEAMASGVPVVATDVGSIPEIAGGVADLHHPRDIDGMAHSILRLLADDSLRARRVRAGRRRAQRFRWRRFGRALAAVYREALAGPTRS